MSRIVLFVEGDSEADALPALVGRLWSALPDEKKSGFIDSNPMRIGNVLQVRGRSAANWDRYLRIAHKRGDLSAVLAVFDADVCEDGGECAVAVARDLAHRAQAAGAGQLFTLAVVLLRKEFESLLIASYESLPGARANVDIPLDVEAAPRDAKRWLRQNLKGGYKQTVDQVILARALDFERVRNRGVRSFQRLESALFLAMNAIATGQHVSSPR